MKDAWNDFKAFYKGHSGQEADPFESPWIAVPTVVVVLVVFVIVFCHFNAKPPVATKDLPGVALGSGFLLDLLRSALITAIFGVLLMVGVRAAFGHWPFEISTSGLKYSERREVAETHSGLQDQVARLNAAVSEFEERMTLVEEEMGIPDTDVQFVDTDNDPN